MNSVNIIGIMTKPIEVKYLPSGTEIGTFSIAVNQNYKNQQGQTVEKSSFFEVKVIGKQATTISTYFSKGSKIGISGSLDQEQWQDNQGQNRSKVVIKLNSFSFIEKKKDNQQSQQQAQYQQPYVNPNQGIEQTGDMEEFSEELPF